MSEQALSLDSISRLGVLSAASGDQAASPAAAEGCAAQGRCGASAGPDDMPAEVWEKVKNHPCYSEEAHHFFARMHVAVAPACNIQCNYCNRKYDCANESRPGVVSERLTPEQAARKVAAVANELPQLSVLGVAGPGDSLFDARKTFETFARVGAMLPDLKFCISTNGLALPDHLDELTRHAIDHVTITLNCVDPEIGARIYPWIYFKGRRWTGVDGAKILLERQMEGLEGLIARKILVKINSVMIPGINDHHLPEVNRVIREKGAFLHNVMPLISAPEHGTHFGLTGQRGPTPSELKDLQDRLGGGANLMKHCRQCRADAIGLLGEDRGQEFTMDKIPETVVVDPSRREAYRAFVEEERADRRAAAVQTESALARDAAVGTPARLVAITTKGGGRINAHFGKVSEFQIYEVDGAGVRFVGARRLPDKYCLGGFDNAPVMPAILEALDGVDAVLTAKIGAGPRGRLEAAGIEVYEDRTLEYIEPAIGSWYAGRMGAALSERSSA
ncbi:nitrogenase cofactor biosynthesis protein NifB [Rhodospirillum rubrum]|uniref:nitrogenase cofactor biosynthesis protein NifB n=1 Tax=Rhodospirillum rubrum TaxID=1085 RepID=UPI001903E63A|nr:nitrogenase cofactor biosynthesis protein NifB [Rhodospirillum rubrum]MBK1664712.1 nitrogenase cofactor biosynthesis protein NifB [Rhodospirillum rubrum]MBK1676532.1 nitrogenase cofactor biosynthesis protein NifB [Rhodospirillum rubrum]